MHLWVLGALLNDLAGCSAQVAAIPAAVAQLQALVQDTDDTATLTQVCADCNLVVVGVAQCAGAVF